MFTIIDTNADSNIVVHSTGCSNINHDKNIFLRNYGKEFTFVEDKDDIHEIIELSGAVEVLSDNMDSDDPYWENALVSEVLCMVHVHPCAYDSFLEKLREAVKDY